jgi:hypothetical protein
VVYPPDPARESATHGMTNHERPSPRQDDLATRVDLASEAWLILADVAPREARMLWLHVVEEQSYEQIAAQVGCGIKTVQRGLNGFTHTVNGRFYDGARQWFEDVMRILASADDAGCLVEGLAWFDDARGRTLWGVRYPVAAFQLADAGRRAGVLPPMVRAVDEARRVSAAVHADVWGRLLTLWDEQRADVFFERLRALDRPPLPRVRELLQELVAG